ncbi:Metallo-hydrolase/oxidoreductase [Mrakia frigida]|uniref:MBL fold metallo-hydrolase n=1 Tax=Mrakia frigida TaxID=29902 RepID=UPI003FCBF4A8
MFAASHLFRSSVTPLRRFSTSSRLCSAIPVLQPWKTHLPAPSNPQSPLIHTFFHSPTSTWQFLVVDQSTKKAMLLDPALDYDPSSGAVDTKEVHGVLGFVREKGYSVERIIETHVHADHLTGAQVWKKLVKPTPPLCIGKRVVQVQATLAPAYAIPSSSLQNAFDHLLDDDETFQLGSLTCTVKHLPGHTPDSIGIQVGDCVFAGDSIFLPDVGSARADFPGGSASHLYSSTQFLLSLPPTTRIFSGHDYPGEDRSKSCFSTVADQKMANLHLKDGVEEAEFLKMRKERDSSLAVPRLLHASLQVNLRGGRLPEKDEEGRRWMRVPIEVKGGEEEEF